MFVYHNENTRLPIKIWRKDINDLEAGCLEQAVNLSNLPFAFHHIALMPDTHQGYGMPIGGVLATRGYVVPNAVGLDIGCGMYAARTNLTIGDMTPDNLQKIIQIIKETIPVGFHHHEKDQSISCLPIYTSNCPIVDREFAKLTKQIGTLGGGNHFIEIQQDRSGTIWLMVHSGSRNLGKQIADYYNKLAVSLNEKWYSSVEKKKELAFLPIDSDEGQAYLAEMNYALEFAKNNRLLMVVYIHQAILEVYNKCELNWRYDIHHNYAVMEHHFGADVMIHRKGATLARKDHWGIIPGSQGTNSYIVKGKGNADSFDSCSHGAGRAMGRKEAIRNLDFTTELKKLNDQGIIHNITTQDDLEEASGAYKDIEDVMLLQNDLVEKVYTLSPLAVVKG